MSLVSLHVDGAERACGTQVFAGTTSDATLGVDYRYAGRASVLSIRGYHLNGTYGAMSCTVTASYAIGQRYTVLLHPHRMTNLC